MCFQFMLFQSENNYGNGKYVSTADTCMGGRDLSFSPWYLFMFTWWKLQYNSWEPSLKIWRKEAYIYGLRISFNLESDSWVFSTWNPELRQIFWCVSPL